MKIIGITGNSGSGKTIGCEYLKKANFAVIDLDKIGHSIYENKECFTQIINKIGSDVLTENKIDRKKLSKKVFADYDLLKELTNITDKYIFFETKKLIDEITSKNDVSCIIIDGALILESCLLDILDFVILVEVDEDIKIKRIINRDNISFDDAFKRVKSQKNYKDFPYAQKYIIYNNEEIDEFLKNLMQLIAQLIRNE